MHHYEIEIYENSHREYAALLAGMSDEKLTKELKTEDEPFRPDRSKGEHFLGDFETSYRRSLFWEIKLRERNALMKERSIKLNKKTEVLNENKI